MWRGGGDVRSAGARRGTAGRRTGGRWVAATALAGVLSLTACGSGGDDAKPAGQAAPTDEEPAEEPRPSPGFSTEPTTALTEHYVGQASGALNSETAYLADHGGLTAYDLETGEERWRLEPEAPGLDAYGPDDIPTEKAELSFFQSGLSHLAEPILTDVAGTEAVLAARLVDLGEAVGGSLQLADADSGDQLWSTELRPEFWETNAATPTLYLGEVHDERVVVTVSNGSYMEPGSLAFEHFVIDLGDGEVQELGADVSYAGHANGALYTQDRLADGASGDLVARDPATGEEKWRTELPGSYGTVYGPWILVSDSGDGARLLSAEDRSIVRDAGEGLDGVRQCDYDPALIALVCVTEEEIVGVGEDGQIAWTTPTDGSYTSTRLFNGYLYAQPAGELIVLDVLTGETVTENVTTTPHAAGPTGVLLTEGTTVSFHAAE